MRLSSSAAVTGLLALNALVFAYAGLHSLFFLGDLTVPEGAIVLDVKKLFAGQGLYGNYTQLPYILTPYTPLYYLASAALALPTTKTIYALYICCRLLTLASTFGAAYFARKIFLLLTPDKEPLAWLAFLLPFTNINLISWGFAARPDVMATMLSLAGIYAGLRNNRAASLYTSAVILVLAWGCKQSFIAAPAAMLLTLAGARRWRDAGLFLLAYGAAAMALAGMAQYFSHGWFFANVVTANVTVLRPGQVYELTLYGYFYLAPFISVAALWGLLPGFRAITGNPQGKCVAWYLLASVALNMAACMKEGAYFNYLIEPLFIASIVAALTVTRFLKHHPAAAAMPLALLATLALSYQFYWNYDGALDNDLRSDITLENSGYQSVIDKINALPGDMLTSESVLAVRSDKPVLIADMFNVRYLELEGKLSTKALADRIRNHELAAIVAPNGCQPSMPACATWPLPIRQAILDAYAPGETFHAQAFWYPKQAKTSP